MSLLPVIVLSSSYAAVTCNLWQAAATPLLPVICAKQQLCQLPVICAGEQVVETTATPLLPVICAGEQVVETTATPLLPVICAGEQVVETTAVLFLLVPRVCPSYHIHTTNIIFTGYKDMLEQIKVLLQMFLYILWSYAKCNSFYAMSVFHTYCEEKFTF